MNADSALAGLKALLISLFWGAKILQAALPINTDFLFFDLKISRRRYPAYGITKCDTFEKAPGRLSSFCFYRAGSGKPFEFMYKGKGESIRDPFHQFFKYWLWAIARQDLTTAFNIKTVSSEN